MPACTLSVEIPSGGVAEIPDFTGELTATDNRTPLHLLIVEQDPPAGTLVGVGAYIITTTITDQSGNQTTCTNVFCVTAEAGVGPFLNTAQSYTAFCPDGTTGASKTAVIAAGTYSSTTSQADADSQALAAAVAQANAALCCCAPGEECEECPDVLYPYGYGYDSCYDLYVDCYPYLYGCLDFPLFPSSDVEHYWPMNEVDSTTRRDLPGPADLSPSVVSGTIDDTPGKIGNACIQTGSNVNLQYVGTQLLYGNTGFTLFGWMRRDQTGGNMFIDYEHIFGGPFDRIRFRWQHAAGISTYTLSENVTGTPIVSTTAAYTLGDWIFVTIRHNATDGPLSFSINDSGFFTTPTDWTPPAGSFTSAQIFFYGDVVRVFDEWGFIRRAITLAQRDYLYNGFAGRTWPFA